MCNALYGIMKRQYHDMEVSRVKRVLILLLLVVHSLFLPQAEAAERFADLKNVPWAEPSIYFLNERGSIAGTGNGKFSPNMQISRAQAVAILVRELYGDVQPQQNPGFKDVEKNHYFYKEIAVATERGLIGGFPDKTFKPNANLSRAETVSILERAYHVNKGSHSFAFKDVNAKNWAFPSIEALASNHLIGGYEDQTFRPNHPVNRAEFAVFLTRVIQFGSPTFEATYIGRESESPEFVSLMMNGEKKRFRLLGLEKSADKNLLLDKLSGKKVVVEMDKHGGENEGYIWYGDELVNERLLSSGCAALHPDFNSKYKYYRQLTAAANSADRCEAITIDEMMKQMSLEEKVGQLLMPMLRSWNGNNSSVIHQDTIDMLEKYHIGGVILFEKEMISGEQVTKLTHDLQKHAGKVPLFIGTDQEGGSVKRIPNGTNMPGNMALGATGNPALAYEAGRVMGTELDALGINVNFAPSLDVNVNPNNPIVGIRSFSEDPQVVADFGVQLIKGLQAANVMATAKHFPGHGDTTVDSHVGLPELKHDIERLEAVELKPFRAAIANGVDMMMTAHITFPAIDNSTVISKKDGTRIHVPATLSEKVLTGLLRERLGFDGVIITDAFTMKAISDHFGEQEAAVQAVKAGADIVLMPQEVGKTSAALVNAVKRGEISEKRINQSVKRILQLKVKYGLYKKEDWLKNKVDKVKQTVGSEKHRQIERSIAEQAVTVKKSSQAKLLNGSKIAIAAPTEDQLNRLVKEAKKQAPSKSIQAYTYQELQKANIQNVDYLILATYMHRDRVPLTVLDQVQEIVNKANTANKGYVVLSLGDPYELLRLKNVQYYMAVYGEGEPNMRAGLGELFK